jgi:hypothetical protein
MTATDREVELIEAHIRRVLDEAPKPTREQLRRVASLLRFSMEEQAGPPLASSRPHRRSTP